MNELAQILIDKIDPLPQAKIVFVGFTLPQSFGGGTELEFGNPEQTAGLGLSPGSSDMAKDFVKNAIEDLFSDDSEIEHSEFSLSEEGSTITVIALD